MYIYTHLYESSGCQSPDVKSFLGNGLAQISHCKASRGRVKHSGSWQPALQGLPGSKKHQEFGLENFGLENLGIPPSTSKFGEWQFRWNLGARFWAGKHPDFSWSVQQSRFISPATFPWKRPFPRHLWWPCLHRNGAGGVASVEFPPLKKGIEGGSINGRTPQWMVHVMANPIKIDDWGGYPYLRKASFWATRWSSQSLLGGQLGEDGTTVRTSAAGISRGGEW